MLETLLQIGKILRESKRLQHHRYIKRAPLNAKKTTVVYFSVPVIEDFSFGLEHVSPITDEDFIRNQLFYLAYKTSDSDNQVKYIFGDISFGINAKGDYFPGNTYYQLAEPGKTNHKRKSSFERGDSEVDFFRGSVIEKFRKSFSNVKDWIETYLRTNGSQQICYLHFDFQGKHWYEFTDELHAINNKLLKEFLNEQKGSFVLQKSLYKTLASADKDVQFPRFHVSNQYKTRNFGGTDEILDLFYAINYSETAVIRERDIKLIVLPKGNQLTASHIEGFFERRVLDEEEAAEEKIDDANQANEGVDPFDRLFAPVIANVADEIIQFDFIFSKAGGVSAPDVDMIEVAGIERSFLTALGRRVSEIRRPLVEERDRLYPKRPKDYAWLDIRKAFFHILGDTTKAKKKYQSHLFRVLPKIYTGTYFKDDVLLPAFIEKTEFNIRQGESDFNLMKYDYEFLTRLLNNGGQIMEEMKNSPSYQAGLRLGRMAQPVSWKINSFEKNYVGLLSRRISDRQRLIEFANFINEKLAIHDVAYQNLKDDFVKFSEIVTQMNDKDYDRRFCAFGFFESYFSKYEKSEEPPQQPTISNYLEEMP